MTALLAGLLASTWMGGPAQAGGGRLSPVEEHYEPGQTVTMVGYTSAEVPDEPFYAYLADRYVGELVVRETGHGGYLRLRVSITFDVPEDLPAGDYELDYCGDPCTDRLLGDLIPSPLSIGVPPARRVVREWPTDEPEIANLAPGALLVGPDFQATAGEVRAARTVRPPEPPPTTTPATAPASTAVPPPPVVVPPPVATGAGDDMAWPVPTALVLGASAATALVLRRVGRFSWRGPRAAAVGRTPDAVSVHPG